MRPAIALALACAGLAPVAPALAETLRCGAVLIQPGDDARYVLEMCGEPGAWTAIGAPVLARGINGGVYGIGVIRADRWLYHRDFGQFPAVVSIGDDGRVTEIEFEKTRD
jgi:Protein of unknown function (DUF2845)